MAFKKNQNGFTLVEGLAIILVLAVVALGGVYVWHSKQAGKSQPNLTVTTQPAPRFSQTDEKNASAAILTYCQQANPTFNTTEVKGLNLNNFSGHAATSILKDGYIMTDALCYDNSQSSGSQGSSSQYLLKETNSKWTVIYGGQQAPACSEVDGKNI